MKIIVTASDRDLDAAVDPRFGRARYFVVVDTDTDKHEIVDNIQNLNAAQGAGVQAAQTVAGLGAEAILTGHCGPKAYRILEAAGMRLHVGITGTVREAIARFKEGNLSTADGPDVEQHW